MSLWTLVVDCLVIIFFAWFYPFSYSSLFLKNPWCPTYIKLRDLSGDYHQSHLYLGLSCMLNYILAYHCITFFAGELKIKLDIIKFQKPFYNSLCRRIEFLLVLMTLKNLLARWQQQMGLNIFNFLLIHLSLKNSNENLVKKSEKNTVAFEILNYDTQLHTSLKIN